MYLYYKLIIVYVCQIMSRNITKIRFYGYKENSMTFIKALDACFVSSIFKAKMYEIFYAKMCLHREILCILLQI